MTRYRDGTVELEYAGDEVEEAQDEAEITPAASGPGERPWRAALASGPGECSNGAYDNQDRRVEADLRWYYNPNTTPDGLSNKGAVDAIRRRARPLLRRRAHKRRPGGPVAPR